MPEELKKYVKIVLGILATILLGAIGSGLWERFLAPFLDWLARKTVGALAWGHMSYRDSIYENAAKGFHESHSLALYTLVIGLLPIAYWMILNLHPTERETKNQNSAARSFVRSRKGYWVLFAATLVVFFNVMFSTLRLRHINETITYSLAAFEIVRPYVGEEQYLKYRSRYFSMRSAAEFDSIHNEVAQIADKYRLKLPDYKPL